MLNISSFKKFLVFYVFDANSFSNSMPELWSFSQSSSSQSDNLSGSQLFCCLSPPAPHWIAGHTLTLLGEFPLSLSCVMSSTCWFPFADPSLDLLSLHILQYFLRKYIRQANFLIYLKVSSLESQIILY